MVFIQSCSHSIIQLVIGNFLVLASPDYKFEIKNIRIYMFENEVRQLKEYKVRINKLRSYL